MRAQPHVLSIVEAVETLSNIANLGFDQDVGIVEEKEILVGEEKIPYQKIRWFHEQHAPATINVIREIFRSVLNYLREFYRKEAPVVDEQTLDKIKTIMLLVGEAARKLDNYTHLFHQKQISVMELEEYQQLQHLYRDKVIGRTKVLSAAENEHTNAIAVGLIRNNVVEDTANHLFLDVENIKKDDNYELYFIRREDNSYFFHPHLLRDVKLICNFEILWGERSKSQTFEQELQAWRDRVFRGYGRMLIKAIGTRLNRFFRESRRVRDHELVAFISKALLALMMSTHIHQPHTTNKNCADYFKDFQLFLRAALQTTSYQKYLAYAKKSTEDWIVNLLDLVHVICRTIYLDLTQLENSVQIVSHWLQNTHNPAYRHSSEKTTFGSISSKLVDDYKALTAFLGERSDGCLMKFLKIFEERPFPSFDTILQQNLPNHLFTIDLPDKSYNIIRHAIPVRQEFIHKAAVNEEFRDFILHASREGKLHQHLLICLHNALYWRDNGRWKALNDFQKHPDIRDSLQIVSLAIDSDFYHQLAPYDKKNHAIAFKQQFKKILISQHAGYQFPETIKREEFILFINNTLEIIHRLFFSHKNVLSKENRMNFIELFHLFLQLKCIEWLQPDSISLSCKDAIDIGEMNDVALFLFLKQINNQPLQENEWAYLNWMIYGPSLLIRARNVKSEKFYRMLRMLKVVENAVFEFGAENFTTLVQESFMMIFKTPILHARVIVPRF